MFKMKKILIALVLAASLSCAQHLISSDYESVSITANPVQRSKKTVIIKDPKLVENIVWQINCGRKRPVKFGPTYRITFNYKDRKIDVDVGNRHVGIGDRTFELPEDIQSELKRLVETH